MGNPMRGSLSQLLLGSLLLCAANAMSDSFEQQRQQMVAIIEAHVADTAGQIGRKALAPEVMEAMASVPRHLFIPEALESMAYLDRALPIGSGQTISQPYIVALMTDLIEPRPGMRVLEVGTGSGYQAAVLAGLVDEVFTIEIVPRLAEDAAERLRRLGYGSVTVKQGNGYQGWPQQAPFDAIVVTAGGNIPPQLLEQLQPGGRMVIPVGETGKIQYLTLLQKDVSGSIHSQRVLPVQFVPLVEE